jgi:hypothetical protein
VNSDRSIASTSGVIVPALRLMISSFDAFLGSAKAF